MNFYIGYILSQVSDPETEGIGLNPWCVNEGIADPLDSYYVNNEVAKFNNLTKEGEAEWYRSNYPDEEKRELIAKVVELYPLWFGGLPLSSEVTEPFVEHCVKNL